MEAKVIQCDGVVSQLAGAPDSIGLKRQKSTLMKLPLDLIDEDTNIRSVSDESVAGLSMSVQKDGMYNPITVQPKGNRYAVVVGHRRFRSAKLAGWKTIPAFVVDATLSDVETIVARLTENLQRKDLTPMEKARTFELLQRKAGWSASEIAVRLSISPGTVSKACALLNLPESVQEKVSSGALSPGAAYVLSLETDAKRQCELADEAVKGRLTRDEVTVRAKSRSAHSRSSHKRQGKTTRRERLSIPLGGGRTVAVAGPSLTVSSMIEWLADLIERLRAVQGRNVEASEAVKLIASQG